MQIKGFLETSLIDWDGRIASVLFLPGCNFRCPFCHNHALAQKPDTLETIPWETVSEFLASHRHWIDGVTVTGGEPTIHDDLAGLLRDIRQMGFLIKLDTNGGDPGALNGLLADGLADYVAMDIKAPFDGGYQRACGAELDVTAVIQSAGIIMETAPDYEFRTTIVPVFHKLEDIRRIGRSIKGAKKWALQQFVPDNAGDKSLRHIWPYSDDMLEKMQQEGAKWVERCEVRGLEKV
jgi:pyruvate formate lyase activating enzyme